MSNINKVSLTEYLMENKPTRAALETSVVQKQVERKVVRNEETDTDWIKDFGTCAVPPTHTPNKLKKVVPNKRP